METTYLMSKAISSALNRRKNFHLSRVLFELSDFEDGAQEKAKRSSSRKFKIFNALYFLKTIFFSVLF